MKLVADTWVLVLILKGDLGVRDLVDKLSKGVRATTAATNTAATNPVELYNE